MPLQRPAPVDQERELDSQVEVRCCYTKSSILAFVIAEARLCLCPVSIASKLLCVIIPTQIKSVLRLHLRVRLLPLATFPPEFQSPPPRQIFARLGM
jgi:hypothetical protein